MRTFLTIASTTLIVAATLMLVWRPVLGFALALLGFAVNLWRLSRASRPAQPKLARPKTVEPRQTATPATPVIEAEPSPKAPSPPVAAPAPVRARITRDETPAAPANDSQPAPAVSVPTETVTRVLAAGWQAGVRGPVLYCAHDAIRLALIHVGPAGPLTEDVTAAVTLKVRHGAHFVGIVCTQRPDAALATWAADQGVQFVNVARLEAYLAIASSFKPPFGQSGGAPAHKASA